MRPKALTVLIVTTILMSSGPLMAEPPCNQIGHESLQALVACASQVQATRRYMDTHGNQIMGHLSTQNITPPHPYPSTYMGLAPFIAYAGATIHGLKGYHLKWPASYYIYTGSPFSGYPRY